MKTTGKDKFTDTIGTFNCIKAFGVNPSMDLARETDA